ncbi:MAG: sulfatase-like hydrolase/transferase, partial [Verrucomicrobiota bacterium]
QSIIDYTRSPGKTDSAAIDPIFDATPIKNEGGNKDFAHYWTSTTHLKSRGSQNGAVYFAFGRSLGWMQNRRTGELTLMDVHGAGSQRADPKVGDASRFPQGRGPQGDVVRIQNMVRLVRGGEVALLESGPPLESSEQRQSSSRGARGGGENRFLNRFDSNGDRSISRDEFTGRPERFRTLDTNGDGVIDESEAANARPPEGQGGQGGRNGQGRGRPQAQRQGPAEVGQGANRLLSRFDSNEDGQVTREEFTGAEERFRELDTDENGLIDEAEIQNARPPQDRENVMGSLASDEVARESDASKPNFVFIFADDLGWTGTSVEMIPGDPRTKSDFYQTPHIEKLAARGMRFSANYAPAAVCTPSRAAVLTGKTPAQLHITSPGAGLSNNSHKLKSPTQLRSLPESETTIAEVLSRVGYRSAYFGKWHLGSGNPGQHGFHTHDGSTANATPANEPNSNPKDIFGLNDRAIAFMKENVDTGTPFYVQLFHYAVHAPLATRAESEAKFGKEPSGKNHQNATYAAMTWDFDQSIGLLMDEIDKMGIADNTYIVFTSDNGAAGGPRVRLNNSPLSKGKSTLYEGGLRVPMIVVGPGIEENSHSAVRVTGCDLFPTFCEWAGIDDLEPVDGTSLASLLAGETNKLDRHVSSLLFHSPHYGRGPDSMPASSIIAGDYKLIRFWDGMNHLLFNLAEDLGEQKDLSKKEPGRLEEMTAMLDARLSSVGAQLLTKNMDYDPNAAVEERARGAGRRTQQGGGGQNRRL